MDKSSSTSGADPQSSRGAVVGRREILKTGGAFGVAGALAAAVPNAQQRMTTHPAAAGNASAGGPETGGYRLAVNNGALQIVQTATGQVAYTALAPLQVIVRNADSPATFTAGYQQAGYSGVTLVAKGEVSTAHGSTVTFTDTYTPDGDAFVLQRNATITQANAQEDLSFNSAFTLGPAEPGPIGNYGFFVPGLWYDQNAGIAPGSIASDMSQKYFYIREMRMALPLVMLYDPASQLALALSHDDADPATQVQENQAGWWVDESITYASLGAQQVPSVQLAFVYPGWEGEITYISPRASWAYRSHPMREGFEHSYKIRLSVGSMADFTAAMKQTWRYHFDLYRPQPAQVPLGAVFSDEIDLLDTYAQPYNGVMGLPFVAQLPDGLVQAVSYQMGYVGQQIPAAYQLLRWGILHGEPGRAAKGTAMLDFWAKESPTSSGLPMTWYNVLPATWRGYPTYLRVASDGMDGVYRAAAFVRSKGQPNTLWEDFAKGYADWLVSHQNSDGSWYRAYNFDSTPYDAGTYDTTQPIRFLVHMAQLTGNNGYLQAALKGGQYAYGTTYEKSMYVGGTPDTTSIDKEAAVEALHAFLALYDATQEEQWLQAAVAAADYTETWQYAWTYQVNTQFAPGADIPAYRLYGTRGQGIISTGGSGTDVYLAVEVFDYYRLYLYTGDTHYKDFALYLATETKLSTNWSGRLGYAYPGLAEEAIDLSSLTYGGVRAWLPWITVAETQPLSELEDAFGNIDINVIEKLSLAERQARNLAWARGNR